MMQANHRYLYEIGIRPLNWPIDGFTLDGLAFIRGQGEQVRQETFAPEQRVDISLSTCLVQRTIDVTFNTRECLMIVLDKGCRFTIAHAGDIGQTKGGLPVERGVHHRFRQPALVLCNLRHRYVEQRSGYDGMNILVFAESLDQARLVCDMSQDA